MLTFGYHSVMDSMRELLKKYPLGYEGYLLEKGIDPAKVNTQAFEANKNIVAGGFQTSGNVGVGEAVDGKQHNEVLLDQKVRA